MSTALATTQPQALSLNTLDVITRIAPDIYKSRMFGVQSQEQAVAVMIKGHELGFGLTASFEFIKAITTSRGTVPTLVPKGMMALIMNSPVYKYHAISETKDKQGKPESCTVTMERTNGFKFSVTFTMADAERAGLIKEGGAWQTYPANMLRWRALGYAADQVFPDVLGGMHRADEFGAAISEDGEVIEGSWSAVDNTPQKATQKPTPKPDPEPSHTEALQRLIGEFGPMRVMEAMQTMPATNMAEVNQLRMMLSTAQAEALDGLTLESVKELEY
jgi:hypothetical protein